MATRINQEAAQRPDGKPGDDRKKERMEEPFRPEEPEEGGEVGGRDQRYVSGRGWIYPAYWHYGPYIWLCDGYAYRGWHWHPNPYSPGAWDEDPC